MPSVQREQATGWTEKGGGGWNPSTARKSAERSRRVRKHTLDTPQDLNFPLGISFDVADNFHSKFLACPTMNAPLARATGKPGGGEQEVPCRTYERSRTSEWTGE